MPPRFFRTPSSFRAWLAKHHATTSELLVGFHKKGSGTPSMTWPESVDEALCYGWIDGVRKRIDDVSYTIRFSPRRTISTWSAINIARAKELEAEGRMERAGLAAFARRGENRSGIYAYEQRSAELPDPYAKILKKDKTARAFFEAQPPSYRKLMCFWIVSAKQEETRMKRLDRLIVASAGRKRL
jgi:uncharacterized protein YdeI (YjbR/CyaY-like superfamily)